MTLAAPAAPDTGVTADTVANENAAARQDLGADNTNPTALGGDVSLPPVPDAPQAETAAPLSKRDEIALNARRRRQEMDGEDATEITLATTGDQIPPFLAQQEADRLAAEAANVNVPPPANDDEPGKIFKLKVRGNELDASRDELLKLAEVEDDERDLYSDAALIRLAQRNMAAQSYLDEAKATSKSARLTVREEGTTPPTDTVPDEPTTRTPTTQHQGPDFAEVVREIQYGDPDEVGGKLATVIQQATSQALSEEKIAQQTAAVSHSLNEAAGAFEAAHPDIAKDEDKAAIFYGRFLVGELRKDLLATGADPAGVEKVLAGGLPAALDAYKAVTVSGRAKLRTPAEMIASATQSYRAKFAPAEQATTTPAPNAVPAIADRVQAKRGLSPQPSRTAAPTASVAKVDGQSPQKRSSVVQEMLKRRGRA